MPPVKKSSLMPTKFSARRSHPELRHPSDWHLIGITVEEDYF
ncbi:hypothetical protein [Synechocystis sp. PCC 7509]|nr:hypothetical protein [Synechocystis sp. PCC 7509]